MKTLKLFGKKSIVTLAIIINGLPVMAQEAQLSTHKKNQWGITVQSELKKTQMFDGEMRPFRDNTPGDLSLHAGLSSRWKVNKRISITSGLMLGYRKASNMFYYLPDNDYGYGSSRGCVIYTPEINSVLEQVELQLPVAAQFYILPEKLSFNIGTLINKSLFTKLRGYYYEDYSNLNVISEDEKTGTFGNWNLGLSAGMAYQFKIKNIGSLQLEPNLTLYPGIGTLYGFSSFWGMNCSFWL